MDKAISFKYLRSINGKGPDEKVYRKKKVEKAYEDYRNNLLAKDQTPKQVIVERFLQDSENFDRQIMVEKNKFPYNLEDGITQLVVWVNPMYDNFDEDAFIRDIVEQTVSKNKYSLYKQDPQYGSIPDLVHYHLFIDKGVDYEKLIGKH